MKQHTPGPWAHTKSREHSNPDTARRDIVAESQFGPAFIAGDVSQFDAALISAAPELLSALNLLLDKLHAHAPGLITNQHTESAITKAEMAISKAKGGA